ncbi:MAG: tRNA pseudouridine(55) synthase TruB [Eubacteriales bacterium]
MQNSNPSGILVINKHAGVTSHDIVNAVRRLYGTKQVGHTGTLDPMATGVLTVLVGRAAKAAEYLVCNDKKYRAVMRLGLTTDTEDITGKVLSQCDRIPGADEVINACRAFEGEHLQTPPMYSALKVGGRKLCDIARDGGHVDRQPRKINIYSLKCAPLDGGRDFLLDVHCSSGTYIRTLCADIGNSLGCGGVMTSLVRTSAGGFDISVSHTVKEITDMSEDERCALLMPTESLFATLPEVRLGAFYERLCRNGCEIYQKKIKTSFPVGRRVRICGADGTFFALGEVGEYGEGTAIKAIKLFDIGN